MNTRSSIVALAGILCWFTSAPVAPATAAAGRALASPARWAQDPPQDNREDVKALLKELDEHAGMRGKEDREAVGVIDKLVSSYPQMGPKDRAATVKQLDKCFKEKRPEDEKGARDNQLFLAAATALGEMAPESVDVLMSWIGAKAHRHDIALQRLLILKLGKSKDARAQKPLVKLLDDHDAQIQGAAAEALGEYEGAGLDERKEIFSELLKLVMSVKNAVDADPTDPIPRDRYNVIAGPIVTSLKRLSKHNEEDPQNWQHWWNKNKKEDWDDPKDG